MPGSYRRTKRSSGWPNGSASRVKYFDPQTPPAQVPVRLASPFAEAEPHPLARHAAEDLERRVRIGELARGIDLAALEEPGRGKMFGVLIVADLEGRLGYLSAFSGMLGERWHVDGFAPPLFDSASRDAFWPAGEAELRDLDLQHLELTKGAEITALRRNIDELVARQKEEASALHGGHDARRLIRHDLRTHLAQCDVSTEERRATLEALAQESRADDAERRRLEEQHRRDREKLTESLRAFESRRAELEHQRAERSRQLWRQIAENYVIPNARGEVRTVGQLYAPTPPPGGAGDCAAPKLLAEAFRRRLRPLALAEFWWGAPPLTGGRTAGEFYPACRRKCGVVLPFMLEGLDVEPDPLANTPSAELRIVYEDEWLIVVDKPAGMQTAPGRHDRSRDSVLVRLQQWCSEALIVDPLEPDVSGLMSAVKEPTTRGMLQRQFSLGEADKRYMALLDGQVPGERGVIALSLQGKRALTEWHVIQRHGPRTRVNFVNRTGRPHQLRVHAANPLGLGAAIVGDHIYGRSDLRLMLHAEALTLTHPRTGERLAFHSVAPF